ncbi:MAG: hypothetical protein AAFP77_13780 [Bacteroidota bacterium]
MKITFLMSCFFLSTLILSAQQSIAGVWNTGNDNTKIEIAEVDGIYEGKILSSDNDKAPIGKRLLKDVQLVDGEWKGKLYAAKREEWMDAVLEAIGDQLAITVKAGWVSRTVEWSRE